VVECPAESIIYDEFRGEYICVETGEVLEEREPVLTPEWRFPEVNDIESRVRGGTPITSKVHDLGLHTEIEARSVYGRKLKSLNQKLRIGSKEKRVVQALKLMNETVNKLDVPNKDDLKNVAGNIIRRLYKRGVIKRKNLRAMVAAVLITTLKNLNMPVDSRVVLEHCQVTAQDVWKARLKISRDSGEQIKTGVVDPLKYVEQFAHKINTPPPAKMLAFKLALTAKKEGITSGKGPKGVAAASLYVASVLLNIKKTQTEISEKLEVTEVTLRNRYRDIVDELLIEVNL